jgi:gliding motility-associated-like protein
LKAALQNLLICTLVALFSSISLQAQDCSLLAPGSDAGFDQLGFCAPVTGRVKYFTFYTLQPVPRAKLQVEINWGIAKKRYGGKDDINYIDSLGYDENLKAWVYKLPATTYEYTSDRKNPKCSYPISVQAVINNTLCNTPKQSGTVIVWDKDDANGGSIVLAPETYYACPGTEFTVNFTDESSWNCALPKEANKNWPKRTTQFVYGSSNSISGAVKIGNQTVESFPYEGDFQEYEDKMTGPNGDYKNSATITIPATAKPGERFEITLNNWNYCNPRPESPVQRKAIIEIVAKPVGKITIKNKEGNNATAFCPNEEIRLFGDYYTEAGEVQPEDVRYDWEIVDLSNETVKTFENQKDVVLQKGFPRPGQQKITLKVRNKKTNAAICESVVHETIELIDAPTVQTFMNEAPVQELSFCAEDPQQVSNTVNYSYTFNSNEDFTYTIHLYKRNSSVSSPDSTLDYKTGSGIHGTEIREAFSINYTQVGLYRIQVVSSNNTTGCSTIEESRLIIYENPTPFFTSEGQCAGQEVLFTDLSKPSSVPGDALTSWEWDMDYSPENEESNSFDADFSGQGPVSRTFTEAGNYRVALRVTNGAGCSNIYFDTLQIKPAPQAALSSNYSGNLICPGDTVSFLNNSPVLNSAELFPEGVRYTLHISDSIVTRSLSFAEGQEQLNYSSFFNPSDSVETYRVWLEAQGNTPNLCSVSSSPIFIKVRSGAAAGYAAVPTYSPFEPNCSPKTLQFVTNKATQALKADRYKWSILLNGQLQEEIIRERDGNEPFDTLAYTFENHNLRYLDYIVVLSPEKDGTCINPAINTFRIYPNPWAQFTANPALQACDSAVFELKVNLPVGISDYNWEFSTPPVNDTETGVKDDHFYVSFNRPAYGQEADTISIRLTARNFYGCSATWVEQIVVNPISLQSPELQLLETEGSGCRPLRATFNNLTVGDSAHTTYEFYIENQATGMLQRINKTELEGSIYSKFSYTFRQDGQFKTYLKAQAVLEGGECERPLSAPVAIAVLPDPKPAFVVFPSTGCGSLQTVINKLSDNSSFDTWLISNIETGEIIYGPARFAAADDTLSHFLFENHSTETQYFRIIRTAESAAGCTASDSLEVKLHPSPKAHFQINASLCEPYIVEVDHQTSNSPENTSYTWYWGDGTSSEGANPPPHTYHNSSYTHALHYNLRLIAESPNGCRADSTIRLVVQPKIKANFEADVLTGCAPLHVNLTDKSRGHSAEHSGWYIREKGADSFEFVGSSLLFHEFENNSSRLKTFELMFKAQNMGGCADSVVKEVSVRPEVLADFAVAPAREIYSGEPLTFTNQHIIPGVTYSWNWGDGSAPLTTAAAEVQHTYTNNSTANHYYELSLTAHDIRSDCKSTSKVVITVYPALQISLTPEKEKVCLPEIPSFILSTKNVNTGYWYVGRKGAVDYSRKHQNVYDASLFPNATGGAITYSVTYVGVNAYGNKDSIQSEVDVYPALAPGFTLDGLDKSLPDATFKITNTTPNADRFATHWSFGNGEESKKVNPGSYTYQQFGFYTITQTISNGFCSASYTMKVNVDDAEPKPAFSMEETEGCWPVTVKFNNESAFTDDKKYFWDFGDGVGTSTAIHPTYTYNKPGYFKVTLHVFNRTGTESAQYTSEQLVKIYPMPRADFVVRKELVYTPDEAVYVANYSERAAWYHWDFGDGAIYEGEDVAEPVHYYKKPGVYTIKLLVRSPQGCTDSLTVQRAVTAIGGGSVQTPNGFTPNPSGSNGGNIQGAGQNDIFHPHIKGGVVSYHMQIFNRWGELVFETRNMDIGWDGYYNGRLSPSDVYIYKISAELSDGKRINKMGDVSLIR